jgi:hypothetical protein
MTTLAYYPQLDDDDNLSVAYYLALQGRVGEALAKFGAVESKLQYDYMDTYFAFYRNKPAEARRLSESYAGYPVDHWRVLFANASDQLARLGGELAGVADPESHTQRQGALASTQPSFDFEIDGGTLTIRHANVDSCQVNYYLIDVELLFSRNPFAQEHSDRFSTVRPAATESVRLFAGQTETAVDIPERFRGQNMLIEIEGAGIVKAFAHYAHTLDLQLTETYGQALVSDRATSRPLPGTYVKVFARTKDGNVKFYKDGYTDLRGRFDYASLNANALAFVGRLVMSDAGGAVVRKAAPPAN